MSREVRQGPDGRSPRRTSGGGHGEAVRRVPGYELDSWVATTASGDIWIARNRGSGARVLLKLLQFRTGGPGAGAESRDLARLIGQLREIGHPHLAWVQETIPDGDGAVLVLEYADGGSLDQLMRGRGALDPGEVVTIAGPIAEALAASHGHGLVHGDLTPASIHFTAEGRPLLLDVGLLALAERVTAPSGYADPAETIRPGSAGDVYGLAAVCHATLTGIPALPGQHRRALTEVSPDLPPGLVRVVEAGLDPAPGGRPTAEEFAAAVYAACDPAPVRFPIGLVLTDASARTVEAVSSQDPFVHTLTAGVQSGAGVAGSPLAPPRPPSVAATAHAVAPSPAPDDMGGHGMVDPAEPMLDDDPAGPSPVRLLVAGGIGAILLAAAVVVGVVWAQQSPSVAPTSRTAAQGENPAKAGGAASHRPDETAEPANGSQGVRRGGVPSQSAEPTTAPSTVPPPRDVPVGLSSVERRWYDVLAELDARRAMAYERNDPQLLTQVYEPGSQLLAQDRAEIAKCIDLGCHIEGLGFDIEHLAVVSATSNQVVLKVVDRLQSYTIVDADGSRVERPAGDRKTREITLVRTPGETSDSWLISRIVDL